MKLKSLYNEYLILQADGSGTSLKQRLSDLTMRPVQVMRRSESCCWSNLFL